MEEFPCPAYDDAGGNEGHGGINEGDVPEHGTDESYDNTELGEQVGEDMQVGGVAVQVGMMMVEGRGTDAVGHQADGSYGEGLTGGDVDMRTTEALDGLTDDEESHEKEEDAARPRTERENLITVVMVVALLLQAADKDVSTPVKTENKDVGTHVDTIGGESHRMGVEAYTQLSHHDDERKHDNECRALLTHFPLIHFHVIRCSIFIKGGQR